MEFRLRSLALTDAPSIAKYANNPAIANNLTDKFPYPYRLEDAQNWLRMVTAPDNSSVIRGIEIGGKICGGIGLHPLHDIFRKNVELGYWLGEPYWRKGIVTRAVQEMVALGFADMDINRIFARPFGSNKGSQRVLEKAGFKLEAHLEKTIYKNDRYEDELIYAIRLHK